MASLPCRRCLPLFALLALLGRAPVISGQPAVLKHPLTVEELWMVKRVGAPSIAPDGKWCVVEVTTFDIDKDDSSSNLWLLATDGKQQKQLTDTTGKNAGPRWSPDGKWIAFTSKRGGDEAAQIYVIAAAGGEARRVSKLPMAVSHLKWSHDSGTVYCIAWTWPDTPDEASHRQKEKALKERKSKAVVIDDAVFRYWDHWISDGKRPTVFAVDVTSGKHKNLLAGTGKFLPPYEPSARDYDVSPDGKELCFVADSVKDIGTDVNLDLYTLALDGKAKPKNITADNVGQDASPVYSPDGKLIAFTRSTVKFFTTDCHLLTLHDRATDKNRVISSRLDRSCSNPRWLLDAKHIACEVEDRGFSKRVLFTVNFGQTLITTQPGISERAFDAAGDEQAAVFLQSSFNRPPTVFTHSTFDHPIQIDHFNDTLVKSWDLGKVESVSIKGADDEDVQMWVVYPPNFDPKKKWPLIQVVHGGPHIGVTSDFSFRWNLQLWAAQGYVVGCVNFHGSSGFGKKFADSITGDMATKPMTDIMKATDWFEKQPWIDKKRIAAAGASYGGYMMAWLNGHTDRFKALVCHAGVFNYHSQMASDVVRGRERSLGAFPWQDIERVDKQSAQRFSKNFKTPTLVLHGEKDFRVPLTHGLEYYTTLRLKGVPTRLVYFPDENHWILRPQNSLVWHREVFGWLEKYIGHGPTP